MQTRLGKLRDDLGRLQNTRKLIRWANASSLLFVAIIAVLAVALACDLALDMSWAQRVISLALVIGAIAWSYRRFAKPWLDQSEELIEVALLVERHQQIDSDLVAALQFEQPEAATWGSPQLETAVITRVAEISPKLDVFQGISLADFKQRVAVAACVFAVVVIGWAAYPGYVNAFLNRLLLGSAFYPTNTQITKVVVNQTTVFDGKAVTDKVLVPIGQPVKFEVAIAGSVSESTTGRLRIQSRDGSVATVVDLARPAEGAKSSADTLRGELPRLMDSVTFEAFAGDARTLPFLIEAVPLPVVDVKLEVTPPSYARVAERPASDSKGNAKWHLSVIEGSKIELAVEALNKKLESAHLWIGESEFRLTAPEGDSKQWTFKIAGTPFDGVKQPLEYRIQVTDQQGLQLEGPIRGTVRLKVDQPPRIAASSRTTKIVPSAKPPIIFSVQDDYGLSKVVAQVQVSRSNGDDTDSELEVAKYAPGKNETVLKGTHRLDVSSLKLLKGDELKVTFVAYDYRGDREPKKSFSEPLLFQVTDQAGILSGLLETDQESAKQLDAIIRRELGIGGQK